MCSITVQLWFIFQYCKFHYTTEGKQFKALQILGIHERISFLLDNCPFLLENVSHLGVAVDLRFLFLRFKALK